MRRSTHRSLALLFVVIGIGAGCGNSTAPEKAGPAAHLVRSAGNLQTGVAGSVLAAPIAAKVTDASGRGVANVDVTFQAMPGSGSVTPTTTRTNGSGIAFTSWTLPEIAGLNRSVRAVVVDTATGALLDSVSFTATVVGGVATSWIFGSFPNHAATGSVVPLSMLMRDKYGNPSAGATVSWTVIAGGGTLSAPTSVSGADGVAQVMLTLGSQVGMNTVQATYGQLSTRLDIDGRIMAGRLTYLSGSGFGIGRTSGGRFLVSLIQAGAVETFTEAAPETKQLIATGGTPVVVAVDASGTLAYVSNMAGWLDIIDIGTKTIVKTVAIANAHALALSPAGDRVYVTTTSGHVLAVSTASRQVVASVEVPNGPWGIAFKSTATDSLMYVTSRDGSSVTEVDTKTMAVRRTFAVNGRPHGLAISPDFTTLYVADNFDGRVKVVDVATGTVTTSVGIPGAFGIAISPDGGALFVTTDFGPVAVVDAHTMALTKLLQTDGDGRQVIVHPDGTKAYAADESGWVDVIPR
jgi:YVTN family beta-propeller protein